jgi:ubiquinone biosynthesis monooxygenase Coq7
MYSQERKHLTICEQLMQDYRVRPSLLNPLWRMAATGLGALTSFSKAHAMACTEAVETVVGSHYNDQLRLLLTAFPSDDPQLQLLQQTVAHLRDEELAHKQTAAANDADAVILLELNRHLDTIY